MAWNGSDGRVATGAERHSGRRGCRVALFLAAILIAGAVGWFLRGVRNNGGEHSAEAAGKQYIANVGAVRQKMLKTGEAFNAVPHGKRLEIDRRDPQASNATVQAEGMSREEPKTKREFSNPMDELLLLAMPQEPGGALPPVPINEETEFSPEQEREMLEKLAVDKDDSDGLIARKELVQAMRDEYTELKKTRGWRFYDYIKALEAKANLDNDLLVESWKIHETVFNDPDISDAKYLETLEKINTVLEQRGIKPIGPPTSSDGEDGDEGTERPE